MSTMATLGILNVGAGDTKLSFDKANPVERARAAKIVGDMLKRGYAILVQVGVQDGEAIYKRARAFDPETCEYVIMGDPDLEPETTASVRAPDEEALGETSAPKRGRGRPRKVPADKTHAVAVARTSGG